MIDFEWTIQQIFDGIPRGVLDRRAAGSFLRPHDAIWPEDACQFRSLADRIYNELPSPQMKRQFLDVCLASYFLNPPKAPATVPSWIQDKCPIADLLGCDISIETATVWHWGRAAIPVVDDLNKGHADRIVYALVAFSKGGSHPLYPDWAKNCLKSDTVDAVETAADLMVSRHSAIGFFFWPFIDPQKPVSGRSLGLPVYLSFLSLVKGGAIPPLLATGALDRQGTLIPVKGLPEKLDLAYQKQFKGFIYPKDGYLPLEAERRFGPQGVSTQEEAEQAWGIGPARDLTRLRKILKPVPFEGEIDRLTRDFAGRTKLCQQIDQWASTPDGEKVFWLTGEPGIGKSAIAAKICATRNYIAAYHFCDFNSEEKRDPAKLVQSLTYQLAVSIPEFGERLNGEPIEQYLQEYSEAYTLFDKLITQPLSDNFAPSQRCMVILIDALDEATSGSRNEIAFILSQVAERIPPWLRFIVTSRPEQEISTHFHAFSKHEIEPSNQDNQDDITEYLNNRLPVITQNQIEMILERSDGNFLYVRHITEEIRGNHLSLDRLQEFPKGLNAVYYRFFDRQFGKDLDGFDNEAYPLLCLVLAAFEPLTVSLLRQVLGSKDRKKLLSSLKLLGALFPTKGEGDSSVIVPWHRSLKDWLTTPERSGHYFVDIDSGHSMLAEYGWEQYQTVDDNIHPYFLAWLPNHLVACSRVDESIQLLKDFNIMMARMKAGQLEQLLADYREIHSDSLRVEATFFRENSHILRRGDEAWPAYKIFLQLAIEHADDSPLTIGAERFLLEEKCEWAWLRRIDRPTTSGQSLLVQNFDGHINTIKGANLLDHDRILSWSSDKTVRVWNKITGKAEHIFNVNGWVKQIHMIDENLYLCITDGGTEIINLTTYTSHRGSKARLFSDGSLLVCDRENMYVVKPTEIEIIALELPEGTDWIVECSSELILLVGNKGIVAAFDSRSKTVISMVTCSSKLVSARLLDEHRIVLNCADNKIIWDYTRNKVQEVAVAPKPTAEDIDELVTTSLLLCGPPTNRHLINLNQQTSVCLFKIWAVSDDRNFVAVVVNSELRVLILDGFKEVFTLQQDGIRSLCFCTDFLVLNLGFEVHTYALPNWERGPSFIFVYEVEVQCDPELLGYDMDESGYYMPELHYITERESTEIDEINCIGNVVHFISDPHGCEEYDLSSFEPEHEDCWKHTDPSSDFEIEDGEGYVTVVLEHRRSLLSLESKITRSNLSPNQADFISPLSYAVEILSSGPQHLKELAASRLLIPVSDQGFNGEELHFPDTVKYRFLGNKVFAVCGHNHRIYLYNEASGDCAEIECGQYGDIEGIFGDMREIITWSSDNVLKLWKPSKMEKTRGKGARPRTVTTLSGQVNVTHFLECESYFVTTQRKSLGQYKDIITVFNKTTLAIERKIYHRHSREIHGAEVLPGDRLMVWAESDFSIYDLATKKRLHRGSTLTCHHAEIRRLEQEPDEIIDNYCGTSKGDIVSFVVESSNIVAVTLEGNFLKIKGRGNTYKYDMVTGSLKLLSKPVLPPFWSSPDIESHEFPWEPSTEPTINEQDPVSFRSGIGVNAGGESSRWYADFEVNRNNTELLSVTPTGGLILKVHSREISRSFRSYSTEQCEAFSVLAFEMMKGKEKVAVAEVRLELPQAPIDGDTDRWDIL